MVVGLAIVIAIGVAVSRAKRKVPTSQAPKTANRSSVRKRPY